MSYERDAIRRMHGYTWGEQPQDPRTIKLNTNENPYPPSPRVGEALRTFDVETLRRYPQPTADAFRDRVARRFGLERGNVLVANGGDEVLRLAFTTFLDPGDTFGTTEPSYSLYPVLAGIQGCRVATVPLDADWSMPRDIAERLNDAGARLVCLVNPTIEGLKSPNVILWAVPTERRHIDLPVQTSATIRIPCVSTIELHAPTEEEYAWARIEVPGYYLFVRKGVFAAGEALDRTDVVGLPPGPLHIHLVTDRILEATLDLREPGEVLLPASRFRDTTWD